MTWSATRNKTVSRLKGCDDLDGPNYCPISTTAQNSVTTARKTVTFYEPRQTHSGNSVPQHICGQHGPATAWLTSEWPHNVLPMPKTFTLMAAHWLLQDIVGKARQDFTSLHCWDETEESWLKLHAMCFPLYQTASSPPRQKGSSYLTRTMPKRRISDLLADLKPS
jgi:hypothetical protein